MIYISTSKTWCSWDIVNNFLNISNWHRIDGHVQQYTREECRGKNGKVQEAIVWEVGEIKARTVYIIRRVIYATLHRSIENLALASGSSHMRWLTWQTCFGIWNTLSSVAWPLSYCFSFTGKSFVDRTPAALIVARLVSARYRCLILRLTLCRLRSTCLGIWKGFMALSS